MSGPLVSASAAFVAKNSRIPPYAIEQSLRFDSGQTGTLTRTPSSNGGSVHTTSAWIKAADPTLMANIFAAYPSESAYGTSTTYDILGWYSEGPYSYIGNGPGNESSLYLGAIDYSYKFRDTSAWYHVIWVSTSTQFEIYVNGVLVASKSRTQNNSYYNQNKPHRISAYRAPNGSVLGYINCYMAEVHFVDGTALDPTDLGEYDEFGVWRPIAYSGSYGTNGYYLKFDPSAANGIGHDHSGNGNNWTASGFTTSGAGTDVMSDTPTTNWCTMNPAFPSGATLSNGNLYGYLTSDGVTGTIGPTSGKWYFETTVESLTTNAYIGIADDTLFKGDSSFTYSQTYLYLATGVKGGNGSTDSYGSTYGAGDIIGVAFDLDTPSIRFYKNGVDQGEAYSSINNTGSSYRPFAWTQGGGHTYNFGQREFAYPPGTASATDYFNCVTYTGNGGNLSVTGVGFQPDFVWIKNRGRTSSPHVLVDVVRGATKALTTGTGGDTTMNGTDDFKSFDSDGFSLGTSSNFFVNSTNDTHVAWCWKAGGAASDNTDGDITSSVSVNQDAGFSVVSYTSQSTKPLNVGHGLGKKPDFILTKNRDATASWGGYHSGTGATKSMFINTTGSGTVSVDYFNNTEPTDSVFTVFDSNNTHSYGTSNEFIAYCWTEKAGVSKFGTYTGNGSSTGPFIECGFKPRLVIVKRTDSTSNWFMYDTIRGTNNKLYAENTGTENSEDGGSTSSNTILSLSNGFQMTSGNGSNASGGTYIFMAWAENFSADATYKALNTSNLPAPTVKDGSDYFNTVTYTGSVTDTSTQAVTGVGFQSDLTWIKRRDGANSHQIVDVVRGTGTWLESSSTNGDNSTNTNGVLTSFDADGFTLTGGSTNANLCCEDGFTYVAWNWLAGGSGSSNTDGSITSTVSASPSSGFSIGTFTGTGAPGSIGHGLGVAPKFILIKRTNVSGNSWAVYHDSVGSGKQLLLNSTNAVSNDTNGFPSAPTSSVINVGTGAQMDTNQVGAHVFYAWSEVEGYSKFGSYIGNGSSTDGPFIYTGFAVSWVMCKRTDSSTAGNWVMWDNKRNSYNESANYLLSNTSDAEGSSGTQIDLLSNGFKPRSVGGCNTSGASYIFAAFAENPFGGSGVNPATAR